MRKFVLLLCCAGAIFITGCGRRPEDAAGPTEGEARDEQVIVFDERPMPEALYEMPEDELADLEPEEIYPEYASEEESAMPAAEVEAEVEPAVTETEPAEDYAIPETEVDPEDARAAAEPELDVDPRAELAAMGIHYHKWAFIEAAGEGNLKAVELFLKAGKDPNEINNSRYRETALMWAARGGHADVASLLLEHGADVNSRNSRDMTALGYALMRRHADTAEVLRAAGGTR